MGVKANHKVIQQYDPNCVIGTFNTQQNTKKMKEYCTKTLTGLVNLRGILIFILTLFLYLPRSYSGRKSFTGFFYFKDTHSNLLGLFYPLALL